MWINKLGVAGFVHTFCLIGGVYCSYSKDFLNYGGLSASIQDSSYKPSSFSLHSESNSPLNSRYLPFFNYLSPVQSFSPSINLVDNDVAIPQNNALPSNDKIGKNDKSSQIELYNSEQIKPFSAIRLNPMASTKGVSKSRPFEDKHKRKRTMFRSLFHFGNENKYSLDAPSTFEKPISKSSLPDVNSPIQLDLAKDEQERVKYVRSKGEYLYSKR